MANKSNKNSNQSSHKIPVPLASLPAVLLPWYDREKRSLPWRDIVTPYRTWVSEIMLQQTRVQAVLPYFDRFMAAAPDVPALAELAEDRLLSLWQGLGYYSRARNLRRAARVIAEEYGGAFPRTYQELMALPGVGDYTAGAILSIAFGEPVPAVDGNVLRVAARVGGCELDILDPKNRRQFRRRMEAVMPRQEPGAFNQALMDLGAGICLPGGGPLCDTCPAADFCAAREQGRQRELPVRAWARRARACRLEAWQEPGSEQPRLQAALAQRAGLQARQMSPGLLVQSAAGPKEPGSRPPEPGSGAGQRARAFRQTGWLPVSGQLVPKPEVLQ